MQPEIKIYSINEMLDLLENESKEEEPANREIGRRTEIDHERIRRYRRHEAYPTWDEARRIAQEAGLPVGIAFLSVAHAKARSRADKEAWEQILTACEGRIMYSTGVNAHSSLHGGIDE